MDAALEWAEYHRLMCPSCGQVKTESMNPEMAHAYEAVSLTCYGCATRDAEMRKVANAKSSGHYGDMAFDGMYVAVRQSEG